jgi:UDP:flavonoid glycosyltransferase YjiC (YdhE family)
MSRVAISTLGSFGDVYPYIGLALELRRRGHAPVLAMPGVYREAAEREGLEFRAVRPDLDPGDRGLIARIMDPVRGPEALVSELIVPNLERSYSDLAWVAADADWLITHPAAIAGPIVAEKLGLPWASTVLAPMSFFSVTDPVVPPPAPWVHALLVRSLTLSRLFVRLSDRITRRWARPVQRLRRSLGLSEGANPILAGQHSPFLVLALFSGVLATPQPDWPRQTRVVGPILYNGPDDQRVPAEVEAFLRAGPPPVVFTLGSSAVEVAGRFFETSARAAARLGRRAVLLVGRHAENRPARLGEDVLVVDQVPHRALFPRAAAVAHQGGSGTLHQALSAGRPALVVPHAHDQYDNASRLVRLGVARTLTPRRYTVDRVERELRLLLDTPEYSTRAARAAEIVQREHGSFAACEALEETLGATPKPKP